MGKTACIFGSTGLTGSKLVKILTVDQRYDKIIQFNRRSVKNTAQQITEILGDFNSLSEFSTMLRADEFYCCLGTTIKKAGSKKAFEEVDLQYPIKIAEIAALNSVNKFLVISSIGASDKSRNFYLNVKGKMEKELKNRLGDKLFIFRPSLLLGNRNEKRFGEQFAGFFMKIFGFLFVAGLKKYKAIKVETVAQAMVNVANSNENRSIFESDLIMEIGKSKYQPQ
ncbi:MAG: NAD-dependent epimerase/dehydratase family protein [Bacteroidales bacterium]